MTSLFFLRLPLRRFLAILLFALVIYLVIDNQLMPSSLKLTPLRDILSIEQQQQQDSSILRANNHDNHISMHKLAPGITGSPHDPHPDSPERDPDSPDPEHPNEAAFNELQQSGSHQEESDSKLRLRSPDIIGGGGAAGGADGGGRHDEEEALRRRTNLSSSSFADDTEAGKLLSTEISRLELQRARIADQQNTTLCPDIKNNTALVGHLSQATLLISNLKEAEVLEHYPFLKPGGSWSPTECLARYKVAVIIPFRDRQSHLTRLLDFLVPILKRQLLDFRFIITEQYGNDLFNKGRIMNAAFGVAERMGVDCVIFHDVDMFPQDDRISYGCPQTPRHLGAYVNSLGYQLWYNEIVGGVLAMSMDTYRALNGYSNMYWAWGGEDDDMGTRILSHNMTIERPDPETGRFSMLKHVKRKRTAPKLIYELLHSANTRWQTDGLSVTSWKIAKFSVRPLYYHIYVDVGIPPPEWRSE